MEKPKYEPGEKVLVSMQNTRSPGRELAPIMEIEGTFVRYQGEKAAYVEIHPKAGGKRISSFLLDRVRKVGG